MPCYIGIDLGTSSTKSTLVDETGKVLATATCAYPCEHPHSGWSEQDPRDWYDAAVRTVREAVEKSDVRPEEITGLSFAGQMHGLVTLDASGEVIRPAILWNDGRSIKECEYLNGAVGKDVLTERCGNIAFPGFTAPKLLWMRENEPEHFSRISLVLLPKDYLAHRLTGVAATDVSDASGTLYFDVRNRAWSEPMLELLGITESQLPRVYESWEVVGTLTPRAAADLGLPESVRVCAGAGDNAAAAVGMGAVSEGQCNLSLGTSGTVFLPTESMHIDSANSLHSFADATGAYHLMGCILSAASANAWWVQDVIDADFDEAFAPIDTNALGSGSVVFLPYLMGERSPINDAGARAAFVGMDADATRADMALAVIEGVTFALRQCLDAARDMGVSVHSLTVCGGGAKSALWKKVIADVFGMPVEVLDAGGGPGFGACILAMVGCGAFGSVPEASRRLVGDPVERIDPDSEAVRRYQRLYRAYCGLYPALRDTFSILRGEGER